MKRVTAVLLAVTAATICAGCVTGNDDNNDFVLEVDWASVREGAELLLSTAPAIAAQYLALVDQAERADTARELEDIQARIAIVLAALDDLGAIEALQAALTTKAVQGGAGGASPPDAIETAIARLTELQMAIKAAT